MTSPSRQASTAGLQVVNGASATSFAPSKPTASASGKTLLAVFMAEGNITITTRPTGFTNKLNQAWSDGTTRFFVEYKIADGTEGATLTWSWTGAQWRLGCLFCIDNAQTSGDPTEFGVGSGSVGSGNEPPDVQISAVATVDDMVFLAGGNVLNSAGNWTAPATWTLEQNFSGDDFGVGSIAQAAGGRPATNHMVLSSPPAGGVGSVTIAIKSPAGFDPATVPWPAQVPDPLQVQLVEF